MKKMYNMINNRKGFTLIELIVVIAILAILASIAIPRFSGVQDNAKDRADKASAKAIQSAIRVYEAEKGSLPTAANADTLSEFQTAFGSYLSNGVPTIQKTGNMFFYDTGTGEFEVKTATPDPIGNWVQIR